MLDRRKKCQFQHVSLHQRNKVIILLETNDKCKSNQSQHLKKVGTTSRTTKGTPSPPLKNKIKWLNNESNDPL